MIFWLRRSHIDVAVCVCLVLSVTVFLPQKAFGLAEVDLGGLAIFESPTSEYHYDFRTRVDLFSLTEIHMSEAGYLRYLTFSCRFDFSNQTWFSPIGVSYGFGSHAFTLPVNVFEIGFFPKTMNFSVWAPELNLSWKFGVLSLATSVDWDYSIKKPKIGLFLGLTADPEYSIVDLLHWSLQK